MSVRAHIIDWPDGFKRPVCVLCGKTKTEIETEAERDECKHRIEQVEAERDELLNALCDMVQRACWTDTGELDHMCSGTYEGAIELLERLGKVEPLGGRLYRWVVVQPRERPVRGTIAGRETLPDMVIDSE